LLRSHNNSLSRPFIPITYCGLMAVYDEPAMFTAEIAVSVIVVAAKVLPLMGNARLCKRNSGNVSHRYL